MKTAVRLLSNRVKLFFTIDLWQEGMDQARPSKAFLIRQLRLVVLTFRGARQNKLVMLAPALTYFSLLSIIPATAITLAIARGFGLERYLVAQLQISLAGREELLSWALEVTGAFFSQIDRGLVAITGLGVLIYTLTMLLAALESIFNQIWQITAGRSLLQRLRDYSAIVFLGSLVLIAAGAATVFLTGRIQVPDNSLFSPLFILFVRLASYILMWILFTLLYLVMPYAYSGRIRPPVLATFGHSIR